MTAILVIFNRDGRPVEAPILDAMLAPSRYRGRDGGDAWIEGNVALAHQHFWLTPEEAGERQPLVDPSGRYVITCDARLDNRKTLIPALDLDATAAAQPTDAALILAAYRRWGADCVDHLLGAFVFAVWDRTEQRLFVARDAVGERTAYYYQDDRQLLITSQVAQILAHPTVGQRLDEGMVATFLTNVWQFEDETYFQGIHYCPPAHCLFASADTFRKWRYWDIDPDRRIRYRHHSEYVEHFRSLFFEAVRCRLRVAGPVGVSMSGGMDSTSIAAVAARLLPETGHGEERLKTFSYVFDELASCDERQYILPMVDHCHLDAAFITSDDLWPLRDLPRWPSYLAIPAQDCYVWLRIGVLKAARAAGCRLLLSGLSGDELFHGSSYWLVDVLRERRIGEVAPEVARNLAALSWSEDLLGNGLRMMAPAGLRRAYRRRRPRPICWSNPGLHPDLIARTGLAERRLRYQYSDRFTQLAQWHRYRVLFDNATTESTTVSRELSLSFGLDETNPYMDRRLSEFVMAIGADRLGLPHRTKRLLRDAMAGLLPEVVRQRPDKTGLDDLFTKGLLVRERGTVQAILRYPQIVRREFIRGDWLEQELQAGGNWTEGGYYLWLCLTLELWLDHYWS